MFYFWGSSQSKEGEDRVEAQDRPAATRDQRRPDRIRLPGERVSKCRGEPSTELASGSFGLPGDICSGPIGRARSVHHGCPALPLSESPHRCITRHQPEMPTLHWSAYSSRVRVVLPTLEVAHRPGAPPPAPRPQLRDGRGCERSWSSPRVVTQGLAAPEPTRPGPSPPGGFARP
jgi:hypothetical protein